MTRSTAPIIAFFVVIIARFAVITASTKRQEYAVAILTCDAHSFDSVVCAEFPKTVVEKFLYICKSWHLCSISPVYVCYIIISTTYIISQRLTNPIKSIILIFLIFNGIFIILQSITALLLSLPPSIIPAILLRRSSSYVIRRPEDARRQA